MKFFEKDSLNPRILTCLWIIFVVFHLITAIFSEGFHRPDEHLGMMRMMMIKLDMLPQHFYSWEIGAQIRSWFQPAVYLSLYKVSNLFGVDSPSLIAMIFRFFMAILHLWSICHLLASVRLYFTSLRQKNWIEFFIYTAWFFPFIHARTTTEGFASIGLCLLLSFYFRLTYNPALKPRALPLYFFGFLMAMTFFVRIQTVLFMMPLTLFLFYTKREYLFKTFTHVTLGFLAGSLINIAFDCWGYGEWTLSPWNNLYQNLFLGVAASFGQSPWYYYLTKFFTKAIPPYTLPIIILAALFARKYPWHVLTITVGTFLLGHSAISHKELRFLYPIALPFLLMVGIAFHEYTSKFPSIFTKKFFKFSFYLYLTASYGTMIYSSLIPAYGIVGLYNLLYEKPQVNEVSSLVVVRDPLIFYMGREVNFKYVESNKLEDAFAFGNNYILTDKYHHHLELQTKCRQEYLSSSLLLFEYFPKLAKRSKVWGLYDCSTK